MLVVLVIILVIIILLLLLVLLLRSIPVCNGGDFITKQCGKVLFPWVPKFKLPSGKYCCKDCYLRDIQSYADIKQKSREGIKI